MIKLTKFSAVAITFLIWAVLYLPFLGSRELQGNEARRILPAISIIESGNWITMQLAGQPYYKKPPLINWMVAAAFKISGSFSEFSARIVSSIMVLIFAIFAVLMPSGWLDLQAKTATAIVFLCTYGVISYGRLIEIEASLMVLTGISTLWWLNIFSLKHKSKWALWIIPGIVMGIGLLLKGPIIFVFFYATIIPFVFRFKKIKSFFCVQHLTALIIAIGIFLIWALKMKSIIPPSSDAVVTKTWKAEILNKINPEIIKYGSWFQNTIVAFLFFMPWIVFIPVLWRIKTFDNRTLTEESLAIAKCGVLSLLLAFFLVNIMPGTEARYSVPLLPLSSAISAFALCAQGDSKMLSALKKTVIYFLWVFLFLALTCFLFIYTGIINLFLEYAESLKNKMLFQFQTANLTVSILLLITGIILSLIVLKKKEKLNSGFDIILASAIVVLLVMLPIYFAYIPIENSFASKKRHFASVINGAIPKEKTLYILNIGYQPYLYYLRNPKEYVYSFDDINYKTEFIIMSLETYNDFAYTVTKKTGLLVKRRICEICREKYKRIIYVIVQLDSASS